MMGASHGLAKPATTASLHIDGVHWRRLQRSSPPPFNSALTFLQPLSNYMHTLPHAEGHCALL